MVDLYQENILEHYKNPQNFGRIEHPTVTVRELNPLCGDDVTVFLTIHEKKLEDIKFFGNGCAISRAALSMITELVKGVELQHIKAMSSTDVVDILQIPIGPVRMKCATLGLKAIQRAIQNYELTHTES